MYEMYVYKAARALLPIFHLHCEHILFVYILQQKPKKFRGFKKKFVDLKKYNFDEGKFLKIRSFLNLPWDHARSHKNLGPIGSAVLTSIGYKRTDRQTNRQTSKVHIYIDRCCVIFINIKTWKFKYKFNLIFSDFFSIKNWTQLWFLQGNFLWIGLF